MCGLGRRRHERLVDVSSMYLCIKQDLAWLGLTFNWHSSLLAGHAGTWSIAVPGSFTPVVNDTNDFPTTTTTPHPTNMSDLENELLGLAEDDPSRRSKKRTSGGGARKKGND